MPNWRITGPQNTTLSPAALIPGPQMAQIGCFESGVSFKRRRDPSALSKIRPKGRSVGKKSLKGLEEAIFRARNAAPNDAFAFVYASFETLLAK